MSILDKYKIKKTKNNSNIDNLVLSIKKVGTPKEEYQEYLKSEEWLKIRSEVKKLRGYSCEYCGSEFKINVHHRVYGRDNSFNVDNYLVLCSECENCECPTKVENIYNVNKWLTL